MWLEGAFNEHVTLVFKNMWLLFQDQTGGFMFEDTPCRVWRSAEEGESCLQGWANPQGEFQAGSAGSCGADAGGT